MEILVKGNPKKVKKSLIKNAADYYSTILMNSRLRENIYLEIHFVKNLLKENDTLGEIECDHEPSPRNFNIFIDSELSRIKTLLTLAHEMTHLKQYASGDLYDYNKRYKQSRWHNQIISQEKTNYLLYPWEIEARGYEEALFRMFADYLQKEND